LRGWVTIQATSELRPGCNTAGVKIDSSTTPFARLLRFGFSYNPFGEFCGQ
jgi:hypothetical protein